MQLKAYNSTYKHDFICLLEIYYDSTTPDSFLEISGYNLVLADHAYNIKRGEVCIYYKESLHFRAIRLPYLNQAFFLKMAYNNDKDDCICIVRAPNPLSYKEGGGGAQRLKN